jgi:hypothetical protein
MVDAVTIMNQRGGKHMYDVRLHEKCVTHVTERNYDEIER